MFKGKMLFFVCVSSKKLRREHMFGVNTIYPNSRVLFHQTRLCSDDPGTELAGNIFAENRTRKLCACSEKMLP